MASPTNKQLEAMSAQPASGKGMQRIKKKVFANVVSDRDILNAMIAVGGSGRAASNYLGISHRSLLNRIRKNDWLRSELEVITEDRLDFAESKLLQLIGEGNPHAIMFFLKTIGKDRGYTEQKPEIAVNTNVAVAVVPGLLKSDEWAALSKQYQNEKQMEVQRQLRELDANIIEPIVEATLEEQESQEATVVELFKA